MRNSAIEARTEATEIEELSVEDLVRISGGVMMDELGRSCTERGGLWDFFKIFLPVRRF